MRVEISPGGSIQGEVDVPGDKSIAHRWLILAATAKGRSHLEGLPSALDVRSTASVMGALSPSSGGAIREWLSLTSREPEVEGEDRARTRTAWSLVMEGSGFEGLREVDVTLECGNSGTTMRLVAGVVAGRPFRSELVGDPSLARRPMERVAVPLRMMGAEVATRDGLPPIAIRGGPLRGISYSVPVPSAQVKGAVLLAGVTADGSTTVEESVPTRDHTERALEALGAPVSSADGSVTIEPHQHGGFEGAVPGDVSSAAFLLAGGALTGSRVVLLSVGLNPTRTAFLDVMGRMGLEIDVTVEGSVLGEPVGHLEGGSGGGIRGLVVTARQLPAVIDEVPVLAMLAAHGEGESRFEGASELRIKESDRLESLARGIRGLGGDANIEGDTLVVGGGGLVGGRADASGDHRLAMAFAVGAVGARGPSSIEGMEWAAVSYPAFLAELAKLGARITKEAS